jgi:mannose-6-phosphate isomerase-like protein (cupin superfamily)
MESGRVNEQGVTLESKLAEFEDHWAPRTVATFNGQDAMVVKVQGEFVWHAHPETDDFFLVLKGHLEIRLRDRTVALNAGDLYIVPRGVEHQPYAAEEAHVLLIEPTGTPNTGDPATAAERRVV